MYTYITVYTNTICFAPSFVVSFNHLNTFSLDISTLDACYVPRILPCIYFRLYLVFPLAMFYSPYLIPMKYVIPLRYYLFA